VKTAAGLLLTDRYGYERVWTFSVEMFELICTCLYRNTHACRKKKMNKLVKSSSALWPSGHSAAAVLIE